MRILLDTNVWRYLADTDVKHKLFQVASRSNMRICIAPAIVIETLRMSDVQTRNKIIEVQTRSCWHRLMPDSFLQCEDVKREMIRAHPEWELKSKNLNLFRSLRYDWLRTKGGFWEKVRNSPEKVAKDYNRQDSEKLAVARFQSREIRRTLSEKGGRMFDSPSLREWSGSWRNAIDDELVKTDAWRVFALTVWSNMLSEETVLKQWLGCEINVELLTSYGALDFIGFWQAEAREDRVPREWIRAVVYGIQSERKVTDGNPTDSAIATHAVDVDLIVSADKNFVAMLNRIQDDAPCKTAYGVLVQAGRACIDELLHLISGTVDFTSTTNTRH